MQKLLTVLASLLFLVNCSANIQPLASDGQELTRPLPYCICPEPINMADTTITGNNVYPVSLAVPTPGDPVKAAIAPGAVRPGYQSLINGMSAAQVQLYGRIARYRVWGVNNNLMTVEHPGSFVVKNGSGDWQAYADTNNTASFGTAGTVLNHDPEALYGAPLVQGRYWVYIKAPTGVDPYDLVVVLDSGAGGTERPDQNFMYRKNDQTQLLLSTFYVDSAGNMLPYRQNGGRFRYETKSLTSITGNNVLNWGTATVSTAVNFGDSAFSPAPGMVTITFVIRSNVLANPGRGIASGAPVALNFPDTVFTGPAPDVDIWFDGVDARSATASFETMGNGSQFYYAVPNASVEAAAWISGFTLW